MFCLGITDCTRAFYVPYGVFDIKQGVTRYTQCVLLEVPYSEALYMRLNSDVLTEWAITADNKATTEVVTVGDDQFLMVHFTPVQYWDDENRYFMKLYNKKLPVGTAFHYNPEKDATVPVIEYEIRRG